DRCRERAGLLEVPNDMKRVRAQPLAFLQQCLDDFAVDRQHIKVDSPELPVRVRLPGAPQLAQRLQGCGGLARLEFQVEIKRLELGLGGAPGQHVLQRRDDGVEISAAIGEAITVVLAKLGERELTDGTSPVGAYGGYEGKPRVAFSASLARQR